MDNLERIGTYLKFQIHAAQNTDILSVVKMLLTTVEGKEFQNFQRVIFMKAYVDLLAKATKNSLERTLDQKILDLLTQVGA